jgi:conjugal transfer pilin signal peptidase TrbI
MAMVRLAMFVGVTWLVLALVTSRFFIGIDEQPQRCLPDVRVVYVDRVDRQLVRGGMIAFAAHGLGLFPDGSNMVKLIRGLPGDRVVVTLQHTYVNGEIVGDGLDVAADYGRPPEAYVREFIVPEGHIVAMGATRDSVDSRYYGPVSLQWMIGRAYKVF